MVNEKTRTVRVRLEVPNKGLKLKPGMFVRAVNRQEKQAGTELVIPASAPLITGNGQWFTLPSPVRKASSKDVR